MKKPNRTLDMFLTSRRTPLNLARVRAAEARAKHLQLAKENHQETHRDPPNRVGNRYHLISPQVLSLFTHEEYESAMHLVKEIRTSVLDLNRKVILDLTNCERVDAAAVLKLHAEIELIESLCAKSYPNVTVLPPKSRKVKAFLSRVGFCSSVKAADGAGLLALQSHDDGSTILGNLLKDMNRSLYNGEAKTEGEEWAAMSLAISEAMLNVRNHAYTFEVEKKREIWPERQSFVEQIGRRWWIVGETHNDQLFLALYDKGVGIPNALTKKDPAVYKVLNRLMRMATRRFGGGPDSAAIKAAVAVGVSGTKKGGRGFGLNDISEFVRQNPKGQLRIFSNCGVYKYSSQDKSEQMIEQSSSIHGTLIVWNVALINIRAEIPMEAAA